MGLKVKLCMSTAAIITGCTAPHLAYAQEEPSTQQTEGNDIVVTAGRRSQLLTEVPSNISAVTGAMLEDAGVTDLSNFTRLTPGIVILDEGPRVSGTRNTLIIRGLNANGMNPNDDNPSNTQEAVSTYLGETPVFFPFKLVDIDRVEVLRGPQGTLYGSGSVGGTVRIIPNAPELDSISGEVTLETSFTNHSRDTNYDFFATLNLPLSSTVALRMSGGHQYLGGFIDALGLVQMDREGKFDPGSPVPADPADLLNSPAAAAPPRKDVNDGQISHFRAAMLFEPSDTFEATLRYVYQKVSVDDRYNHNPFFGEERNYVHYRDNLDPQEAEIHLGSLDVSIDVGFAQMTSTTSYSEAQTRSVSDSSPFLRTNIPQYYFGFPRLISPILREQTRKVFTQEVRLVSDTEGRVDWLLGGYYNRNHLNFSLDQRMPGISDYVNALYGLNPELDFGDVLAYGGQNIVTEEAAIYGELNWHITERLSLTGGFRAFKISTEGTGGIPIPFASRTLAWFYGDPLDDFLLGGFEPLSFDDDGVIFRLNASYDINDDTLFYATWAQGYRAGGGNALPKFDAGGNDNTPILSYGSDSVNSYEAGIKGQFSRLSYSATGFWIDWTDMQQQLVGPMGVSFVGNVPGARSRGIELSLAGAVTDRLNVTLGYSYTDAVVTESFLLNTARPGTLVPAGSPLPGTSKNIATANVDYRVPISDTLGLSLHGDMSYRSSSQSSFADIDILVGGVDTYPGDNFFRFSPATVLNLSATLDFDRYALTLFANNVTNEIGTNSATTSEFYGDESQSYGVLRPATVGLRVKVKFGR